MKYKNRNIFDQGVITLGIDTIKNKLGLPALTYVKIDVDSFEHLIIDSMAELFKHSGELLELIEDVVAYYCDENRISGELAYSIVEGIGVAKQLQLIPDYEV